jgi:hypothetical protein
MLSLFPASGLNVFVVVAFDTQYIFHQLYSPLNIHISISENVSTGCAHVLIAGQVAQTAVVEATAALAATSQHVAVAGYPRHPLLHTGKAKAAQVPGLGLGPCPPVDL